MSGLAYMLVRAVRGLPSTMAVCGRGRLWGGQSIDLWQHHADVAIAPDGAPTGVEHAFLGFGVVLARSWWTSRAGALAFRELVRSPVVATALTTRVVNRVSRDKASAEVLELDRIFALCLAHEDPDSLAAALSGLDVCCPHTLDATPWARLRAYEPAPVEPPAAGRERELYDAVVASPADESVALVYADWLEQQGRAAEADALRPEPPPPPEPPTEGMPSGVAYPGHCDVCGQDFVGWRYRCGDHVACSDCAIKHLHRCPHCAKLLVGAP